MTEQGRNKRLKLMKKAARYKLKRLEAALGGSSSEYIKDRPRSDKRAAKRPPNPT